jgi:hypothetical protein
MAQPRSDRFAIDDLVTWFDDSYADACGSREALGDGPFKIVEVEDVEAHYENERERAFYLQANREAAGHTQRVIIDASTERFSGAYFRKVA